MPESTGYAVKNNVESTLADNPLTSSATTLNVSAGQGSRFPSTYPFLITIWDDVAHPDPTDDPNMDITECTARSTDALTIARGKEETSGVEHANGARVAMLITAGIFDDPTYGILTKLNGIEDNATADQTGAEIKTAYESEPNAFTDAKNTKLDGIEDNATADQTKADIDALGINADQVDGHDAGNADGCVLTITTETKGSIYYHAAFSIQNLEPGTDGDVLTTHGNDAAPTWKTPASGSGDMLKSVYDTNDDGKVDDSDKVDGCDAGTTRDDVWKIPSVGNGSIFVFNGDWLRVDALAPGETGYQLTSQGTGGGLYWAAPYSHPSSRQCSSGTWAWASVSDKPSYATRWPSWTEVTSKPSTFPPSAHSTDLLTSGTLLVSRGGTGVTGDSYDARYVNGCDTGLATGNVYKIPTLSGQGGNCVKVNSGGTALELGACGTGGGVTDHGALTGLGDDDHTQYMLADGTRSISGNLSFSGSGNKYLTTTDDFYIKTHGSDGIRVASSNVFFSRMCNPSADNTYECGDSAVRWSDMYCVTLHQGDTAFAEKFCHKCGKAFEVGDNIILKVTKTDEDTVTIPIHLECANAPSKKITVKKRKMKNQYVIDEITGDVKTKQVPELIDKTIMKHKLREGYEFDNETGKVYKLNKDGTRSKTKCDLSTAIEAVEETISEVVYEDVEFKI